MLDIMRKGTRASLIVDYNRKDIRKDLKRLGIDANVEHIVQLARSPGMKYWVYVIGFYTQEDMNLYKLLGNYKENEYYLRHILCSKKP